MAWYAQSDIQEEQKVAVARGEQVSKSDYPDQWDAWVEAGVVAETEPEEVLPNDTVPAEVPPVPADDAAKPEEKPAAQTRTGQNK